MTTITTIDIRTLKVSVHAKRDRWERITRCVQAVGGLGEVIFVCDSCKNKYREQKVVEVLTSTGMILIVNVTNNSLVTAYLGSVRHVSGLYHQVGLHRIPLDIYQMLRTNENKFAHLYHI